MIRVEAKWSKVQNVVESVNHFTKWNTQPKVLTLKTHQSLFNRLTITKYTLKSKSGFILVGGHGWLELELHKEHGLDKSYT